MTFEQWYRNWCEASRSDRCEMDITSTAHAAWEAGQEEGFERGIAAEQERANS